MDIGIIGSGQVAQTLAAKLLELGHSVTISSRDTAQAKDRGDWGVIPSADDFAAAQRGSDGGGGGRLRRRRRPRRGRHQRDRRRALAGGAAGGRRRNLAGKILIDVANPLDFSGGMPPPLLVCNTDSLGEHIQAAFPDARGQVAEHGQRPRDGRPAPLWPSQTDDLRRRQRRRRPRTGSRSSSSSDGWAGSRCSTSATSRRAGAEMYMPLWLRLWGATGTRRLQRARGGRGELTAAEHPLAQNAPGPRDLTNVSQRKDLEPRGLTNVKLADAAGGGM